MSIFAAKKLVWMNTSEQKAENLIASYIELIRKNGYQAGAPEKKQYNFEVDIKENQTKLKLLVYFGSKGIKTVIQGNKDSGFYVKVSELLFGGKLFKKESLEIHEPESYIGTDESGKGDYFGPLVICGVYVDKETSAELKKIGVRDSKELSENSIRKISSEIKKISAGKFSLVVINPEKYNQLHERVGNVNRILGWGHAKVIENLLENNPAGEAISDKFGDESYIRNSLQEKGKNILLHQLTKAERYTAVAAASILAREKFSDWFDVQKQVLGIELQKGASVMVEKTANEIKNRFGEAKLKELVKIHFKTTKKII